MSSQFTTAEATSVSAADVDEPSPAERSRDTFTWKQIARKSLWLILYPAAYLVSAVMRSNPDFVEQFYSHGVFPVVRSVVGSIFAPFPFSFAEFLVYAIICALAAFFLVCFIRALRGTLSLRRFISWILTIAIVGGVGLNAFYWLWGFNYYRATLASRMGLELSGAVSSEELQELTTELAAQANTLRELLAEDSAGVFEYREGNVEILNGIPPAYDSLSVQMPQFFGAVNAPKPVAASELMSDAQISGIFIPFTEEANVNIAGVPLLVASSAAHEAAHALGIAREEEANFAAYLACIASSDPQIQYSGIMLALIHAGNALAETDPEAYAELWSLYSDGVTADLKALNAYVAAHDGQAAETASELNDQYLRGNSQDSGVRSYSEMVNLLAAWHRSGQHIEAQAVS